MSQIRFTKEHEWIRLDGDVAAVGITNHASGLLNGVVAVELPSVGDSFKQGEELGAVESAKSASEVYAPASGEIVAVNSVLEDEPERVDDGAEGEAWFVKMKLSDAAELDSLLDEAGSKRFIEDEG